MLCYTTTEYHTLFSRPWVFFISTHRAQLPWMTCLLYHLYTHNYKSLAGWCFSIFPIHHLVDHIMSKTATGAGICTFCVQDSSLLCAWTLTLHVLLSSKSHMPRLSSQRQHQQINACDSLSEPLRLSTWPSTAFPSPSYRFMVLPSVTLSISAPSHPEKKDLDCHRDLPWSDQLLCHHLLLNTTVYRMTRTVPLINRVRKHQLRFPGHIHCINWKEEPCMYHQMEDRV